jgi:hypothetical protein
MKDYRPLARSSSVARSDRAESDRSHLLETRESGSVTAKTPKHSHMNTRSRVLAGSAVDICDVSVNFGKVLKSS